jgi:hypothetical protein
LARELPGAIRDFWTTGRSVRQARAVTGSGRTPDGAVTSYEIRANPSCRDVASTSANGSRIPPRIYPPFSARTHQINEFWHCPGRIHIRTAAKRYLRDPTNWGYALAYRNRCQESHTPGATILDLAAAQENFTLALAERGYRVTWNGLRTDLAGYVQKKHERGEVA